MWPISFTLSSPLPSGLWSLSLIHWPHNQPCSLPPHNIYTWCFIYLGCLPLGLTWSEGILQWDYEWNLWRGCHGPSRHVEVPGTNNSKRWNHGGGTTWQELCLQMMMIYIATLRTGNQKLARNRGRKIQIFSSYCFRVDASHWLNPTRNQKQEIGARSPHYMFSWQLFLFINMLQDCNLFLFSELLD